MADFEANPQELAARTRALEEVAKGVKAIIDAHNTEIERIGDIWGTDELGEQFAAKYVPSGKDFERYTGDLVTGVQTSVDEVVRTAQRIHVTEEHNKVRR